MDLLVRLALVVGAGFLVGGGLRRGFNRYEQEYDRWQWRGIGLFAVGVAAYMTYLTVK